MRLLLEYKGNLPPWQWEELEIIGTWGDIFTHVNNDTCLKRLLLFGENFPALSLAIISVKYIMRNLYVTILPLLTATETGNLQIRTAIVELDTCLSRNRGLQWNHNATVRKI